MKINNKEINIEDAIKYADYDKLLLKRRDNDLLLSDYQIDVLKTNGIDYFEYVNINQLLFDIEEILNIEYDEELDNVSSQLAELSYYKDTKKWECVSHFKYLFSLFDYIHVDIF